MGILRNDFYLEELRKESLDLFLQLQVEFELNKNIRLSINDDKLYINKEYKNSNNRIDLLWENIGINITKILEVGKQLHGF